MVNLFQPLIDAMNHEVFDDDPIPINIFLATLGFIFGTSLVIYVWHQGRKVWKQEVVEVTERERWRVIPEEDEITDLEI